MNHFKMSLSNPFKFVPNTNSPNVVSDFDGAWACEQIKWFETKAYYKQKWRRQRTTKIQCESSIFPEPVLVYNSKGKNVKALVWTVVFSYVNYSIYEATIDLSDLDEGVYYLYQQVDLGPIDWLMITEPIWSKDSWPKTLALTYKNSFNDFDVAWTTGIEMTFFVEAAIMDMEPKRDRTDYINQVRDTATLKSVPYREFVFYVGEARGVAPWVIDLLNRIFCCDYINIEGKLYQAKSGAEGKTNRVKNYPLVGWSQEIVEAKNLMSLEFSDTTPLGAGIVTAYEIDDKGFFGPGAKVQITEVEKNK